MSEPSLSLEALRKVDRYGVTRNNEQYTGWTQLPPARSSVDSDLVKELEWLAMLVGQRISKFENRDAIVKAIRKGEQITHPDAGGNPEYFKRVQQIKERI